MQLALLVLGLLLLSWTTSATSFSCVNPAGITGEAELIEGAGTCVVAVSSTTDCQKASLNLVSIQSTEANEAVAKLAGPDAPVLMDGYAKPENQITIYWLDARPAAFTPSQFTFSEGVQSIGRISVNDDGTWTIVDLMPKSMNKVCSFDATPVNAPATPEPTPVPVATPVPTVATPAPVVTSAPTAAPPTTADLAIKAVLAQWAPVPIRAGDASPIQLAAANDLVCINPPFVWLNNGEGPVPVGQVSCKGNVMTFTVDPHMAPGPYNVELRTMTATYYSTGALVIEPLVPELPTTIFFHEGDIAKGGVLRTAAFPLGGSKLSASVVKKAFTVKYYPNSNQCNSPAALKDKASVVVAHALGPDMQSLTVFVPAAQLLPPSAGGCMFFYTMAGAATGVEVKVRPSQIIGGHPHGPVSFNGRENLITAPLRIRGINLVEASNELDVRLGKADDEPCSGIVNTKALSIAVTQFSTVDEVDQSDDVAALLVYSPADSDDYKGWVFSICKRSDRRSIPMTFTVSSLTGDADFAARFSLAGLVSTPKPTTDVNSEMPIPGAFSVFRGARGSIRPAKYLPRVPADTNSVSYNVLSTSHSLLELTDGTLAVFVPIDDREDNSWIASTRVCKAALKDHPTNDFTAYRVYGGLLTLDTKHHFAATGRHALCTQVVWGGGFKTIFLGLIATVMDGTDFITNMGSLPVANNIVNQVVATTNTTSPFFAAALRVHKMAVVAQELGATALTVGAEGSQGVYLAVMRFGESQCTTTPLSVNDVVALHTPSISTSVDIDDVSLYVQRAVFSATQIVGTAHRLCVGTYRVEGGNLRATELTPVDTGLTIRFTGAAPVVNALAKAPLTLSCAPSTGGVPLSGLPLGSNAAIAHIIQKTAPNTLPTAVLQWQAVDTSAGVQQRNNTLDEGVFKAVDGNQTQPIPNGDEEKSTTNAPIIVFTNGAVVAVPEAVALDGLSACGRLNSVNGAGVLVPTGDKNTLALAEFNMAAIVARGTTAAAASFTISFARGSTSALSVTEGTVLSLQAVRAATPSGAFVTLQQEASTSTEVHYTATPRGPVIASGVYSLRLETGAIVQTVLVVVRNSAEPSKPELPGGWLPLHVTLDGQLYRTGAASLRVQTFVGFNAPAGGWDVVATSAPKCSEVTEDSIVASAVGLTAAGCDKCLVIPAATQAESITFCVAPSGLKVYHTPIFAALVGAARVPVSSIEIASMDFVKTLPISLSAGADSGSFDLLLTKSSGPVRSAAMVLMRADSSEEETATVCANPMASTNTIVPHYLGQAIVAETQTTTSTFSRALRVPRSAIHTAGLVVNTSIKTADQFVVRLCITALPEEHTTTPTFSLASSYFTLTNLLGFPAERAARAIVLYFVRSADHDSHLSTAARVTVDLEVARPIIQSRIGQLVPAVVEPSRIEVTAVGHRTFVAFITPEASTGQEWNATKNAYKALVSLNPTKYGNSSDANIVIEAKSRVEGDVKVAHVVLHDIEVVQLPTMESVLMRVAVGAPTDENGMPITHSPLEEEEKPRGAPGAVLAFFAIIIAGLVVVFIYFNKKKEEEEAAERELSEQQAARPPSPLTVNAKEEDGVSPLPRVPGFAVADNDRLSPNKLSPRNRAMDARELLADDNYGKPLRTIASANDTTENPLYSDEESPPPVGMSRTNTNQFPDDEPVATSTPQRRTVTASPPKSPSIDRGSQTDPIIKIPRKKTETMGSRGSPAKVTSAKNTPLMVGKTKFDDEVPPQLPMPPATASEPVEEKAPSGYHSCDDEGSERSELASTGSNEQEPPASNAKNDKDPLADSSDDGEF